MQPKKAILTSQEINIIECEVTNRLTTNITLWKNANILAESHGTYLQHKCSTSQFGNFTCEADCVSVSTLVQESGINNTAHNLICIFIDLTIQHCTLYFKIFVN